MAVVMRCPQRVLEPHTLQKPFKGGRWMCGLGLPPLSHTQASAGYGKPIRVTGCFAEAERKENATCPHLTDSHTHICPSRKLNYIASEGRKGDMCSLSLILLALMVSRSPLPPSLSLFSLPPSPILSLTQTPLAALFAESWATLLKKGERRLHTGCPLSSWLALVHTLSLSPSHTQTPNSPILAS